MPSVNIAPVVRPQFFDNNAVPASGGTLETYVASSSTPLATYTDSTGATENPVSITLNARGEPAHGIWLAAGQSYKFVYKDPSGVTVYTEDNLRGINDTSGSSDEWVSSGIPPSYISVTSFSLDGDQTAAFHIDRRIQAITSGGTRYGTITSTSVIAGVTTVVVELDSGSLDAGLSAVNLSRLSAAHRSVPRRHPRYWLNDLATGGSGTDADPYTGWQTATLTAKRTYNVEGVFSAAAFPDFRLGGVRIRGQGPQGTVFVHTGAGVIFGLDGGTVSPVAANYDFSIEDCLIKGNASSTYGIDLRNVHRHEIRNVTVVNVTAAGLRGRFSIGAEVSNFVCDVNGGLSSSLPISGIVMDTDGVNGGCNAWNVSNFNIRGCSGYGIDAVYAQACNFFGGQVESNDALDVPPVQFRFRASSTSNKVYGIYANNRLLDDGVENEWHGVTASSLQLANATRARVFGGKVDDFVANNTSTHCLLVGLEYTTSITNSSASLSSRGVFKSDGTYLFDDVIQNNISGKRFSGQIELIGEERTASGAFATTSRALELNHDTVAIVGTWAPALIKGQLVSITNTSSSGTVSHTLKATGITFDGTNNTVTLNAPNEAVLCVVSSATRLRVLSSAGTPTYSVT